MGNHSSRDHALLSASGAHRWLECPGSARLEDKFEDTASEFAAEGTLAHEIAELKIKKHFTTEIRPSEFKKKMNELKKNELYSPEMDRYTDEYKEYINDVYLSFESRPFFLAEQKVDFSAYVPEGFGTVDCTLIGGRTVHIFDLKYGKGVSVYAENNPQAMLYALGTYLEQSLIDDIDEIIIHIVQPRIKNITDFKISSKDLLEWAEGIKEAAEKAYSGTGEFNSGSHCRFCKANGGCRKQAEEYLGAEMPDPAMLTDGEVGEMLGRVKELAAWTKKFEEYALKRAMQGANIKGWKIVEGRAGNRSFTDVSKAFDLLKQEGMTEDELFEKKAVTLTAIEKLIGPERLYQVAGGLIRRPEGKPALVLLSDKRPAMELRNPADVFKDEII